MYFTNIYLYASLSTIKTAKINHYTYAQKIFGINNTDRESLCWKFQIICSIIYNIV